MEWNEARTERNRTITVKQTQTRNSCSISLFFLIQKSASICNWIKKSNGMEKKTKGKERAFILHLPLFVSFRKKFKQHDFFCLLSLCLKQSHILFQLNYNGNKVKREFNWNEPKGKAKEPVGCSSLRLASLLFLFPLCSIHASLYFHYNWTVRKNGKREARNEPWTEWQWMSGWVLGPLFFRLIEKETRTSFVFFSIKWNTKEKNRKQDKKDK